MSPLLCDSVICQYKDSLGFADGGQSVGNDKCSPVLCQALQGLLHDLLAFIVKGGCGLIEDQYGRVLQEHPGNRQPLFLTP